MSDYGFFLTHYAIRRQLAAMPNELFLVRLIDPSSGRCSPSERLWTASQLTSQSTVRFLRARNRQGFDVYFHPYVEAHNSGYILVDLDQAGPHVLDRMRVHGHDPSVVLQSSPGHFQVWVRISPHPLTPVLATAIARQLAHLYGGDLASTDWRHLGRLAGFTNQKPQRRRPDGYAPWVKLLHAQPGFATQGAALIQAVQGQLGQRAVGACSSGSPTPVTLTAALPSDAAGALYQAWFRRLRIPQRFPHPDWSIADKWIAKELLRLQVPHAQIQAVLRFGSPGFPRHHSNPEDYLCRTVTCAARELRSAPFPGREGPPRISSCAGT